MHLQGIIHNATRAIILAQINPLVNRDLGDDLYTTHPTSGLGPPPDNVKPFLEAANPNRKLDCIHNYPKDYCNLAAPLIRFNGEMSTWGGAKRDTCQPMINELRKTKTTVLDNWPRNLCAFSSDVPIEGERQQSECCFAWGHEIKGMTHKDLADWAEVLLHKCPGGDGQIVMGKTLNANIHDQCTDLCISGWGTDCWRWGRDFMAG